MKILPLLAVAALVATPAQAWWDCYPVRIALPRAHHLVPRGLLHRALPHRARLPWHHRRHRPLPHCHRLHVRCVWVPDEAAAGGGDWGGFGGVSGTGYGGGPEGFGGGVGEGGLGGEGWNYYHHDAIHLNFTPHQYLPPPGHRPSPVPELPTWAMMIIGAVLLRCARFIFSSRPRACQRSSAVPSWLTTRTATARPSRPWS